MEFNETLSILHGRICSLGSQGLLNKEDSLQDVLEALRNFTQKLPHDAKSEAAFFMVLNTQLSITEELRNDEIVGLFTNITPPIEIGYLITYMYHLNLQTQLFKVIENCPGTLGIEMMDAILKKLENPSFHRDEFGLEHFYQLWQSVFVKICKMNCGLHLNDHLEKFILYFGSICDLVQKIIVTSMTMKGLESIAGLHLYYFFKSFLFCLKLHKNPNLSDDPLYKLNVQFGHEEIEEIENPVSASIDLIFSSIVKILEKLTLDLWMTFAESYFDFDLRNSIQLLIGSTVNSILEEGKDSNIPSDVLNCLSSLAIDKFTTAGSDEIIFHIRNGEKEWFEVLVKHPAVIEPESVKCLIDNIHLASSDDLNMILTRSYEYICNAEGDEDLDLMKDLFLTAVKKSPDYSKWLKKVLESKSELFTTTHAQDELTEIFNKISKEKNLPKEELISLCIQLPLETTKKMCHLAISGSLPIENVVEVLKVLQHPCDSFQSDGPACLDCVLFKSILLEELTDKEKNSLIDLLVHMGKEGLLGSLFARNLVKALKTHLEKVELEKAILCLKIIKTFLNWEYFVIDKVVLLVFLSQVLGFFSWDLDSFATVKADGRDLIICIVALIINGLDENAIDSKHSWAVEEIVKCCEVNQACFCDLWFRYGCIWPCTRQIRSCILALAHTRHKTHDLTNILINIGEPFDVRASIVLSLTVLLPVVTFREWNSIFDGLIVVSERGGFMEDDVYHHVLDMFGSSLYLLTLSLRGKTSYPCYECCLRNFGRVARRSFPKMKGGSLVQTLEKIFFVLTAIEDEEEKKSCLMIFLPLMMDLIDRLKKKNALDAHRSEVRKMLVLLDSADAAETLEKALSESEE